MSHQGAVRAAALAVLLCLIGAGVYLLLKTGGVPETVEVARHRAGAAAPHAPRIPPDTGGAGAAAEEVPGTLETLEPAGGPEARNAAAYIAGCVVVRETGEPVTEFGLELFTLRGRGQGHDRRLFYRQARDEEGRFFLPLEKGGAYCLHACSASCEYETGVSVDVPDTGGIGGVLIELERGRVIAGRVQDGETGAAIAGALVTHLLNSSAVSQSIVTGEPSRETHALTGANGEFRLAGAGSDDEPVVAAHPEYAAGCAPAGGGDKGLVIELSRGYRVFGETLDDDGRPCPNVLVTALDPVSGDEDGLPFCRVVLSDEGGSYRTPPLNPGRIRLTAAGRHDGEGPACRFATEHKAVELACGDVRVDFGPSPLYVTWRGRVIDRTGMPPAPASLRCYFGETIGPAPRHWDRPEPNECRIHTGGDGGFEQKKLLPGSYNVRTAFAPDFRDDHFEIVRLPAPGVVERDIEITGGSVRGVVIDERTGGPASQNLRVDAIRAGEARPARSTFLNRQGQFAIRGLTPGFYSLTVDLPEQNRRGRVDDIVVAEGRLTDGISVQIPAAPAARGYVVVRVSALPSDLPGRLADYSLEDGPGESGVILLDPAAGGGAARVSRPVEPGAWSVEVHVRGLGRAEKSCPVVAGQTTIVEFTGSDLTAPPLFRIEGSVRFDGGGPAPGARVIIRGIRILGPERETVLEAAAGSDGEFAIDNAPAGSWDVETVLPGGGRRCLPRLEIAASGPALVPLEIRLRRGSVSGILVNAETGAPLAGECPPWQALLLSAEHECEERHWHRPLAAGDPFVRLAGANHGARLALAGVPAATYVLYIEAEDYLDYASAPFAVRDGESVDLGAIPLAPGGILIVEAVDPRGAPVDYVSVSFDDPTCSPPARRLSGNRVKLLQVPYGEHRIRVEDGGGGAQHATVVVRPGGVAEIRVILAPSEENELEE